ncbi:MAG: ArsR/SmtB family transcription factor [Candidatus Woesearchaeota archaeon]
MGYNTSEPKKKRDDYVNKNFLLVSLEEKKAKKIAEVINNDTARRIIDQLAKKDATESDLSKDLKIPISTVHYNLKQLQDSGLVVVEEFHYSQKGKEVNHYTLANKYIIIAPRTENPGFLEALKKIMPLAVITAGVAFVMQLFNLVSSNKYAMESATFMAQDSVSPEVAGAMLKATPMAQEIARPAMQSAPAAYFLIGGLAVLIIYFVYEWIKKN